MNAWLDALAARRRFGMKPGLGRIARLAAALGHPERRLGRIVHIAGTNGKGAVAAILDAALRANVARVARYTSPHLVRLNERFMLNGEPMDDAVLERAATRVAAAVAADPALEELTFFEALTAVGFLVFAEARPDWTVLETGLGGRLDATNVCDPALSVITRIGLDHCDWLGDTVERIASEKAGIVKPGRPVVLGRNEPSVRAVVESAARALAAPFVSAPDVADESEIPSDFSLAGAFNRENAVTALAALRTLGVPAKGFGAVFWPGRFQRVGDLLIDGAHNPPAARALAAALAETPEIRAGRRFALVAGFCGDKDVDAVLGTLAPYVGSGVAVRTCNPRSLEADETAARMRRAGIAPVRAAPSLAAALEEARATGLPVLVAGSLFLAGEVLRHLGALPWKTDRQDPSCLLRADGKSLMQP